MPTPTECLLTETVPSAISNALTVAIPVTRSPSLAVITPTESIFVTSSYVNLPPTPTSPVNVAVAPLILPVTLPSTAPLNVVAVITPEVILFTVTSAAVPSARKIEISPPCPVILETPDILFGLIQSYLYLLYHHKITINIQNTVD